MTVKFLLLDMLYGGISLDEFLKDKKTLLLSHHYTGNFPPSLVIKSHHTGKEVTFKQFALTCARAFGALVHMRDEPLSAPIEKPQQGSYHEDHLEDAQKEYDDFNALTDSKKQKVFEKLDFTGLCAYCGQRITIENMQIDQLVPNVESFDNLYSPNCSKCIKENKNCLCVPQLDSISCRRTGAKYFNNLPDSLKILHCRYNKFPSMNEFNKSILTLILFSKFL